jgi:hypothetical protein
MLVLAPRSKPPREPDSASPQAETGSASAAPVAQQPPARIPAPLPARPQPAAALPAAESGVIGIPGAREITDEATLKSLGIHEQLVTVRDPQDPTKTKVIRLRHGASGLEEVR